MEKYRPDKTPRLSPGGTQQEIVKFILNSGGACYEPDIREHLRDIFNITAIAGVKGHLEKLEKGGILNKQVNLGSANKWSISETDERSYEYISDLIVNTTWDSEYVNDISVIFGSDLVFNMTLSKIVPISSFLETILPLAFRGGILEKKYPIPFDELIVSEDTLNRYRDAITVSPTLFVTGAKSIGHKSLLTVIAILIQENRNTRHSVVNPSAFINWLSYYAILAGFMIDITIYPPLAQKIEDCAKKLTPAYIDYGSLLERIEDYKHLVPCVNIY